MTLPISHQTQNGAPSAEGELARSERRRIWFCLLVGLAGIAITLFLSQLLRTQEHEFIAIHFRHDAERRIAAIQQAANDRLSVINIVEAFYAGSESVERSEFHTFTEPLLQRFQGVRALGWAPLVPADERGTQEKAVREAGFPNYRITEQDDQGKYVPAGKRAEYCPVVYIEPYEKYMLLMGFDLRSDPACRDAIERAMATGRQAAAVCTPMGKDATGGKWFYVVAPIPKSGTTARPSDKRPAIAGFVFGVFDINAIVEETLKELPPVGIDVIIREPPDTGSRPICTRLSPLHFRDNLTNPTAEPAKPSATLKPFIGILKAVDRQGQIECIPMKAYLSQYQTWGPALALLAGLVITVLLVGLLFLLTGRTARVRRLAAQRTQELRASEQRFRRLVENAGDAFFLHEIDGRILDMNKAAGESLGYSRDELLQMNVSDLDVNFISDKLVDYHTLPEAEYPVTISSVHRRKDGSTFPVEVRLAPINVGNKRLILGLARDITERKLAEKKLHDEQRLLREMLDLMEQDRKLVAYEIHDGLAQQLTGADAVPVRRAFAGQESVRRAKSLGQSPATPPRGDGRGPPADRRIAAAGSRPVRDRGGSGGFYLRLSKTRRAGYRVRQPSGAATLCPAAGKRRLPHRAGIADQCLPPQPK